MDRIQAEKLKLNVSNLNSFLTNSNRTLRTLRVRKSRLIGSIEKQDKRKSIEKKIETKDLKGGLTSLTKKVLAGPKSIFDKIKEFFSLLLVGMIINNLPKILNKLKEFFNSDFIKSIGNVLKAIGKAIFVFVDIVKAFPKSAQDAFIRTKEDIERQIDQVGRLIDPIIRFFGFSPTETEQSEKSKTQQFSPSSPINTSGGGSSISLPVVPYSPLSVPGYAKGGSIGRTGQQKASKSDASLAFGSLLSSANQINSIADQDAENISLYAKLVEEYKESSRLSTDSSTLKPGSKPGSKFGSYGAYSKVASGVSVDATGEPGADFTPAGANNRAIFSGTVVEIGHQYNPNRRGGDGEMGAGYGNYIVVRSKDPTTGQSFDSLYAHFPSNGINVKHGQSVNAGDVLGRMGTKADPRREVGSLTGAHTSVDFYKPGSNQPYPGWRNLVGRIDPTFKDAPQIKPLNNKAPDMKKPGGGYGSNRQVIIYARQKVQTYLPMPMPVPVNSGSNKVVISNKPIPSVLRV